MTDLAITKIRRDIIDAASKDSHGVPEHKWAWDADSKRAIATLIEQKLISREMGDVGKGFGTRLRLTERGWAAQRGDTLTKL